MSYSEAIHYLYNLQKYGIKLGLDNTIRLMEILGNPQQSFQSIHVAGTNGKGSTSAIIASILKTAGLKVGLFTSPHLISFTERIRINDEEIAEDEVINLTEEIRKKISSFGKLRMHSEPVELNPTFFEFVTTMAFLYFQRKKIDIAIIEVGMGGRLDATNVIVPEVSVITNVSCDHREFLGNTLEEIANEKAGIIKNSIPVVVSSQSSEVLGVIETKADEKNTKVYLYGRDFSSVSKKEDISGIYFDYLSGESVIRDLYLPLTGEHQLQNASVAIKAVELLNSTSNPPSPPLVKVGTTRNRGGKGGFVSLPYITQDIIREGLKNVRWPGRLEIINEDPPILIDGAHNPAAAVALLNALLRNFSGKYEKIILILGIMGDKDIKGIMEPLLPLASEIILTAPHYERAASPAKLKEIAAELGFSHVQVAPTVKDAIEMATKVGARIKDQGVKISNQRNNSLLPLTPYPLPLIVVTGSFYTIGEAKEVLGQKGVLTRLRE
ncbi:MAG: bifunctional folylpolyglutamate synthase/dihydrofolate synthase [Nitrospira sp.]|nr:bifunctional folylpolyglutamate synthase/dihydrofolate synthase [Nitrospira sp.]